MVSALNLHLHLDLPRGDYMAWVRIINGFLTEQDICFMFCSIKSIKNNLRLNEIDKEFGERVDIFWVI